MELTTLWFLLIAVLWIGYFVLEGFDFGVGLLLPVIGHGPDAETRRRVMINTIGPVWDGNEVWLIVAGGATFAAFPEWYATLFSGFYLPLLIILLALIARGVAFEFRGTRDDPRWRARWDLAIFLGSLLPAVLWGVAFGNIVRGVKIDAHHEYAGTFFDLLNPYALVGGLTTLALFVTHGAVFLSLKTAGDVRTAARGALRWAAPFAVVLAVVFLGWTLLRQGDTVSWITGAVAAVALLGGLGAAWLGRDTQAQSREARRMGRWGGDGWAFTGVAVAIGFAVITLFVALFPDVMPSTIDPAYSLTTTNASSTPYTLRVMTWVAAVFTPIVLIYQGWSYWVFRRRLA